MSALLRRREKWCRCSAAASDGQLLSNFSLPLCLPTFLLLSFFHTATRRLRVSTVALCPSLCLTNAKEETSTRVTSARTLTATRTKTGTGKRQTQAGLLFSFSLSGLLFAFGPGGADSITLVGFHEPSCKHCANIYICYQPQFS